MSLSASALALQLAGESVAEAANRIGTEDPGPRAFGADGPGALGELGRALHQRWLRALDARVREAVAQGARLREAADAVARAAADYAGIDENAQQVQRQPEVP